MGLDANPLDDPADIAAMQAYSTALMDALDTAIADWVVRSVCERWRAWSGQEPHDPLLQAAMAAGERARAELMPDLRALLTTDVDLQRSNPLALVRRAVTHPTLVLTAHGVPPVRRDADAERIFPDDTYDLSPASFAEVDPSLHEPGLAWGAAKAHLVLRRRRADRKLG